MNLKNKINYVRYILNYILIISFIITILFVTVSCAFSDVENNLSDFLRDLERGDNGEPVNIAQTDMDNLKENWQSTLDSVNNGVLELNKSYMIDLMLDSLYIDNITSTENLTITFTPSDNGIVIDPESITVSFQDLAKTVQTVTLMTGASLEVGKTYTIGIFLTSTALEQNFTFDLDLSMSMSITQADIDNLKQNWQSTIDSVNNGVLELNKSYMIDLMLDSLYIDNITSTENLTITFTPSDNGIGIDPESITVSFQDLETTVETVTLMTGASLEVGIAYTIGITLTSTALEQDFTFDLDLSIPISITQTDIDNFRDVMDELLRVESTNFIEANTSFTLTLSFDSLYSANNSLTLSTPLTISFVSSDTDITISPTSHSVSLADLSSDTLNWDISYSANASRNTSYNIDISIMSDVLANTLSSTLNVSLTGDIFDTQLVFSPELSAVNHSPVLALSNLPRRSSFTYTLEQASSTDFLNISSTIIFTHIDIDDTTFEYSVDDSFSFSDWGSTFTVSNKFYRLSIYDSGNTSTLITQGNTSSSDVAEIVLSSFTDNIGDGSEATPYEISSAYQLQEMGTIPNLDFYFILVQDIDTTETLYWGNSSGFNPIDACESTSCGTTDFFKGSLDGRGYTISNLYINRTDIPAIGLFGAVAGTTSQIVTIENLTLSEATIKATSTQTTTINSDNHFTVGSFVGYINDNTELHNLVVDSSSSLSLLSSSSALVSGGLVGRMEGASSYLDSSISYATMSLSSSSSSDSDTGGLVGRLNGGSLSSSISYSILSAVTSSSALVTGGLVGGMDEGSLSSSISYSILSTSTSSTSLHSGGLVGGIDEGSLSSSISYSLLSVSASSFDLDLGSLVGVVRMGTPTLHSNIGVATLWSSQTSGTSNLGSLIGGESASTTTISNNYVDTGFLILNDNSTLHIDPSISDLPLIDDNRSSTNCITAFTYSDNLSAISGSSCTSSDLFYNFETYDSEDDGMETDWNVSDTSFYPRPATIPSVFDLSQLATQNEYRMMASHTLIRFYNGVPIDNQDAMGNTSNTDEIVDDVSNVLFVTNKSIGILSVDDLEESYYPVGNTSIYISQGLDAILLSSDNTLYTGNASGSLQFTYSFALTSDQTSTSSNTLLVGSSNTLTLFQDTTGTYISASSSFNTGDEFYIEVTVNSSASVTEQGDNTSFSRRYRFKKD